MDYNKLTEQEQLEAVKECGWTIQFIKNPSEAFQLEAVKQDGLAIKHIKNPSEAVAKQAISNNKEAILFVVEQYPELKQYHNMLWEI